MHQLTATSYALLGLLAIKPWSAYELAQQMKRGFAWYWPRAERAIYAEPKNLVAHDLARARTVHRGRRPRTVYEITAKGRRALRTWLAEASAAPRFESEALVRLTFLEHGSADDASRAVASLRDAADELDGIVATVSGEYVAGRGPFPDRLGEIALTGSFLAALSGLFRSYATWAAEFVDSWEDAGEDEASLRRLAQLHGMTGAEAGGPV